MANVNRKNQIQKCVALSAWLKWGFVCLCSHVLFKVLCVTHHQNMLVERHAGTVDITEIQKSNIHSIALTRIVQKKKKKQRPYSLIQIRNDSTSLTYKQRTCYTRLLEPAVLIQLTKRQSP